jgi:hypothetical protein
VVSLCPPWLTSICSSNCAVTAVVIYVCPKNVQDNWKTTRTARSRLVILVVALIVINHLVDQQVNQITFLGEIEGYHVFNLPSWHPQPRALLVVGVVLDYLCRKYAVLLV